MFFVREEKKNKQIYKIKVKKVTMLAEKKKNMKYKCQLTIAKYVCLI